MLLNNVTFVVVISIIAVILAYKIFSKITGTMSLLKLNWMSYTFYLILLQGFIGPLVLIILSDTILMPMLLTQDILIKGLFVMIYSMVLLPVGILVGVKIIYGKDPARAFFLFIQKPLQPALAGRDSAMQLSFYILSLLCICSVLYSVYMSGGISTLIQAAHDATSAAEIREELGWDFEGVSWIRQVFALMLTPIVSYIAFAYWQMSKRWNCFIWFSMMFVFSVVMYLFSFAKSSLSLYFIGLIFIWVFTNAGIHIRKMVILSTVVVLGLIGMYMFSYSGQSVESMLAYNNINRGIIPRILIGQVTGLFSSLAVFPELHPHLTFNIGIFGSVLGFEKGMPYDQILASFVMSDGLRGFVTSFFPAEAYAHFGLSGIIIAPIAVGLSMGLLWGLMYRLPKTPILIGVYAYISFKMSIGSGFFLFFYNPNMIKTILVILLTVVFGYILEKISSPLKDTTSLNSRKII